MTWVLIIGGIVFGSLVLGFKMGVAFARTYVCCRCGQYDAEQARIDADNERFDREAGKDGLS
jgi:hypothetical protein